MSKTNALTKPEATQGGTSTSGVRTYSMTANHMLSMSNTLYMYKVDLVWVWSGWEDLIITQQYMHFKILTPLLLLSPPFLEWWYGMVLHLYGHPPHIKGANTFYMYEVDLVWVWSGWGVPIISYSMSPVRNQDKILWPSPPLLEWWYGMVLWHYDCQPW